MILPNIAYDIDILNEKRQYLTTASDDYPLIITTPSVTETIFKFQVLSGPIVANVINQTKCKNGVIYYVDAFLLTPLDILDTISYIPELDALENILKGQNLSNIITVENKTIFAPVNSAWSHTKLKAYGMIVHSLKFQLVNNVYYQKDLLSKNNTLATNYLSNTIQAQPTINDHIVLMMGDSDKHSHKKVNVIRTDILTSSGTVIHLVDQMLSADAGFSDIAIHKLNNNNNRYAISSSASSLPIYHISFFTFLITVFLV